MAIQQCEKDNGQAVQQRCVNDQQASTASHAISTSSVGAGNVVGLPKAEVVNYESSPKMEIVTPEWQYQDSDYFNFEYILSVKEQRRMGTSRGKKSTPQAPAIELRVIGIPDSRKINVKAELWDYGRANDGRHNPLPPLRGAESGERLVKLRENVFIACTENISPFGSTQSDGCRYSILRCYITRGARVQCRKRHIALRLSVVDEKGQAIAGCTVRTARLSVSEKAMCPRECDRKKKEKNCQKRKFETMSSEFGRFAPDAKSFHRQLPVSVAQPVPRMYPSQPRMQGATGMLQAPVLGSSDFDPVRANQQLFGLLQRQRLYGNFAGSQPHPSMLNNRAPANHHQDVLDALVKLQQQRDQLLAGNPGFMCSPNKRQAVDTAVPVSQKLSFNSVLSIPSSVSTHSSGSSSRSTSPLPRTPSPLHQIRQPATLGMGPRVAQTFVSPVPYAMPQSLSPGLVSTEEPDIRKVLNNLSPESLVTVLKGLNNHPDIVQKLH